MRNKKPSKQAAIPTKNESNKGDNKGGSISMKLYLQLKPLFSSYNEYQEYLESNFNALTGSNEHNQIELYRSKVLRQWERSQKAIETLHSANNEKKDKTIFRDILSEYYQLFKKQSYFPEIKRTLEYYIKEGQKKKRNRISRQESAFLQIKSEINPKSFGKFVRDLSARGLDYSNSTYSRLWNKYYSG